MLIAVILAGALSQTPTYEWGSMSAPSASVDATPEAHPGPDRPRLHIESSAPVVMFQLRVASSEGTALSEPLCTSPCDAVIDGRGGTGFFFNAPGIAASGPFQLSGLDGEMEVRVKAGDRSLNLLGYVATSVGVAGMLAGVAAYTHDPHQLTLPLTGLIAGAIVTVVGALVMHEGRTSFEFVHRESESSPKQARPRSPVFAPDPASPAMDAAAATPASPSAT